MLTLVCNTCGKKIDTNLSTPLFGVDVLIACSHVDWRGVMDSHGDRVLAFCSDACVDFQRTKDGRIRKHLKRKKKEDD